MPFRSLLIAVLALSAVTDATRAERLLVREAREIPTWADLVRQCSVVAHVRLVSDLATDRSGENGVKVVQVVDAGYGCVKGDLLLWRCDQYGEEQSKELLAGQPFVLFASRRPDGTLAPWQWGMSVWNVTEQGALGEQELKRIVPGRPKNVGELLATMRNEHLRHRFNVELELADKSFLADEYEGEGPLNVRVRITNNGAAGLSLANFIHCRYYSPYEEGREMAMRGDMGVQIYVQRLGLREELLRELEELMAAREFMLQPGQVCEGVHDIGEEWFIKSGGHLRVWAEVGGVRSNSIELHLPERREALEELKMAELDDGGPLKVVARKNLAPHQMPDVASADHAAVIEAALNDWFNRHRRKEDGEPTELFLLKTGHLPPEFRPQIAGAQAVVTDLALRGSVERSEFEIDDEKLRYIGRAVEVVSVKVDRQTATVEIAQNRRHNLGGGGATYHLRLQNGRWVIDGPLRIWKS